MIVYCKSSAFAATEFNKIFSGRQTLRCGNSPTFYGLTPSPFSGSVDGLDLPVSSTLSHESVPETFEKFHTLTGLSAREVFTE
jgi:hypothetical protein